MFTWDNCFLCLGIVQHFIGAHTKIIGTVQHFRRGQFLALPELQDRDSSALLQGETAKVLQCPYLLALPELQNRDSSALLQGETAKVLVLSPFFWSRYPLKT